MNRLRHRLRFLLMLPLLTLGSGGPATTWAETASEAQVKGAYLYHFTKFVTWPTSVFADDGDEFHLCVLGQDTLGPVLNALTQKSVGTHPILILHLTDPKNATNCHLLFISHSEEDQLPAILEAIQGKPILTVGDPPEFARNGGMIHFMRINDTLRFAINQENARLAGLKIHATLLQVGHVLK
ncbi:MAG: YfiR family protein [Magnetococcales bacterium]|nr:YfiR family protein [Magnetococcales bacterium]